MCLRRSITLAVNNNSSVTFHTSASSRLSVKMAHALFHKHYVPCLDALSPFSVVFHFPNK